MVSSQCEKRGLPCWLVGRNDLYPVPQADSCLATLTSGLHAGVNTEGWIKKKQKAV